MGRRRSFTVMELIVVTCLLFILIGTFANYASYVLKIGKETTLRNELANIRMAVEYFRIINTRLPSDLMELVNKELTNSKENSIILQKNYIRPFRVNSQGYLLDPFMNRYIYTPWDGLVHSNTKGFESW
ncbi:MAG: type II secretion system protein [Candidatus Omnitrophica bacterium]|nr:type II secretion system protein [Candidatus Omnitrophota bacterium]